MVYVNNEPKSDEWNNRRGMFLRLIERNDGLLSEQEELLLRTLYRSASKHEAADHLGMDVNDVEDMVTRIIATTRETERPERLNKRGKPFMKRLGKQAYLQILQDIELDEEAEAVVRALSVSRNQVLAAHALEMSYGQFAKRWREVRKQYGL